MLQSLTTVGRQSGREAAERGWDTEDRKIEDHLFARDTMSRLPF